MSDSDGPTSVAILGGGGGGLAAAWALTATPALRQRFEVSVYERSWALGGNGASGRTPQPSGDGGRAQRPDARARARDAERGPPEVSDRLRLWREVLELAST